jgi:hypothetical protein
MKKHVVLVIAYLICLASQFQAQNPDSISTADTSRLNLKSLILPLGLSAYGYSSLIISPLRDVDSSIKDRWASERKTSVDDYLIYTPLVLDAGLSAAGVRSANKYPDKLALYLMSTVMNAVLVYPVKRLISRERPDFSNQRSFPSGHTSNAFVGAAFFHQEYRKTAPLISGAGYVTAAATGYLRIHNNKHWFSDVIAGAGIGILSTKLSYYLYPRIKKMLFTPKRTLNPDFRI